MTYSVSQWWEDNLLSRFKSPEVVETVDARDLHVVFRVLVDLETQEGQRVAGHHCAPVSEVGRALSGLGFDLFGRVELRKFGVNLGPQWQARGREQQVLDVHGVEAAVERQLAPQDAQIVRAVDLTLVAVNNSLKF